MGTRCPNCGYENRAQAKFCSTCGQRLQMLAPPRLPRLPHMPLAPSPPPAAGPLVPSVAPPPAYPPAPRAVGLSLKTWDRPPQVEGKVLHIDGPHKEKGPVAGKMLAAGCLVLIAPYIAWLPFVSGTEFTVRYLRVEDVHSGQQWSVKMCGEPSGNISIGDMIAVWGKIKGGNLLMKEAYNYQINAEIRLKT
ncbi:MAG: zinc ribbon domain-containing protein [Anaerolineae bacterium]